MTAERFAIELPVRCECPACGEVWEEPVEVEGNCYGDAWYTTVWCRKCARVFVVCHVMSVVSTSLAIGGGGRGNGRAAAQ